MTYTLANVNGRAALVENSSFYDLERISNGAFGPDPMSVMSSSARISELASSLSSQSPDGDLATARLGAPVPRPRKVFGIGLNYGDHAAEANLEVPDNPVVFTKFPTCITGPSGEVELRSDRCDYEGEVVVVIGAGGKDIDVDAAWSHVFGVTVGQDISDRAVQMASKPPHFDLGKSFDTFGPIGPVVVSPERLVDRNDIALRTLVNGEVRQDSSTRHLIFDVPTLVHYLSRIVSLEPGDLIFTGTPAGVGMPQKKWLADGDVITTEVGGVGAMVNTCRRVSDHELPVRRKQS